MTHHFAFGYLRKVNTGELFLFCKKYGLFNDFIFLTIKKFYCPTFQFSL